MVRFVSAVGGIAIAAVIAGLIYWQKHDASASQVVHASSQPQAASRPTETFPFAWDKREAKRLESAHTYDSLLEVFRQSRNIIEFVERAKRLSDTGAHSAAYHAAKYCFARTAMISRVNQALREAESVQLRPDTFCSGAEAIDMRSLVSQGMRTGGEHRAMFASHSLDLDRSESGENFALKAVLSSLSPFQLVFAEDLLFVQRPGDLTGAQVFFDGRWRTYQESVALRFAAMLVACELGFPCGDDRVEVLAECKLNGHCSKNYRELVLHWAESAGSSQQQVNDALAMLMLKMRAGDTEAFAAR